MARGVRPLDKLRARRCHVLSAASRILRTLFVWPKTIFSGRAENDLSLFGRGGKKKLLSIIYVRITDPPYRPPVHTLADCVRSADGRGA